MIFEGEFINGAKNGNGKEYYESGKLKFEGKFIDEKRNGKEYDENGNLVFEGEFINGKRMIKILKLNHIKNEEEKEELDPEEDSEEEDKY